MLLRPLALVQQVALREQESSAQPSFSVASCEAQVAQQVGSAHLRTSTRTASAALTPLVEPPAGCLPSADEAQHPMVRQTSIHWVVWSWPCQSP